MFSIRLIDLAVKLHAKLQGDGDVIVTGVASLTTAKSGQITFLSDKRHLKQLSVCRASAVILTKENLNFCHVPALVVHDPYLAYVKIVSLMNIIKKPVFVGISSKAVISDNVILGRNIIIGANVVIESGVVLGDEVIIEAGSFIGKNTRIGSNTRLFANVTVYHNVEIGDFCLVQSGAVIGSEGFGYIKSSSGWIRIPHLGRVIIRNKVEIGSCTTIDRGTLDDTMIDNGVVIDNQCHIAHNVVIGAQTAIAGGVVIAGSVTIGSNCMIGGASVINGHIDICDKVIITGMGMVMKSIMHPGIYSSGIPLQPNKIWRRTAAIVLNINKIRTRMKVIEQKLEKSNHFHCS